MPPSMAHGNFDHVASQVERVSVANSNSSRPIGLAAPLSTLVRLRYLLGTSGPSVRSKLAPLTGPFIALTEMPRPLLVGVCRVALTLLTNIKAPPTSTTSCPSSRSPLWMLTTQALSLPGYRRSWSTHYPTFPPFFLCVGPKFEMVLGGLSPPVPTGVASSELTPAQNILPTSISVLYARCTRGRCFAHE